MFSLYNLIRKTSENSAGLRLIIAIWKMRDYCTFITHSRIDYLRIILNNHHAKHGKLHVNCCRKSASLEQIDYDSRESHCYKNTTISLKIKREN